MIFDRLHRLFPICYTDSISIPHFMGLRGFERCRIYFDLLQGLTG